MFELSFIGWRILVVLTFGALNLYVSPYYNTCLANYYLSLNGSEKVNEAAETVE